VERGGKGCLPRVPVNAYRRKKVCIRREDVVIANCVLGGHAGPGIFWGGREEGREGGKGGGRGAFCRRCNARMQGK